MGQNTFSLEVTTDHAVPVEPLGGTATVLNVSGDTLFYADNQQVSSAGNQGSLTAGQSNVFSAPAWVVSAGLSTVTVTIVAASAGGSGITSGDVVVASGVSTVSTVLGGKIPVTPDYASTGADGFLTAAQAFRWRGQWASATAYARGDVVTDPSGNLRWCGVAHTSPATFSTGTEFSSNTPWWGYVASNGAFRGPYTTSHNVTYAVVYAPGDIVLSKDTGLPVRALFEDSNKAGVWDATRFSDFGAVSPFALIDPGVVLMPQGQPNSKVVQGLGLWTRTSRMHYPRVKPTALFRSAADFTIGGVGAVTADADPIDPNGCAQLAFASGAGATYTKTIPATDISNSIVRLPVKVPGYGASGKQVGVLGTSLSTGAAITSIKLDSTGLWFGVAPGSQFILDDGAGHTQTFTASDYVSASAGGSVTQIPVNSLTPTFAFPANTTTITQLSRSGLNSAKFQVSSDNFATTSSEFAFVSNTFLTFADTAWTWAGTGPGGWTTTAGKSAANLTAITQVRFALVGSAVLFCSVHRMDVIPNNGQAGSKGDGRAKCALWCDDSFSGDWTWLLATAIQFGFPLNSAAQGAIDANNASLLSLGQIQYMNWFHGWAFAPHYFYPNDGGDDQTKDGFARDTYINRARHSIRGAGVWGQDDFAWHDDDHATAMNLPIMRKNFRAIRGYNAGLAALSTLPPADPMYVPCYGIGSGDTTGGTVAVTSASLTGGVAITSIPVTSVTLAQALVVGETVTLSGQAFTVSATTSGTITAIPVNSLAPSVTVASGTNVLNPGSVMKAAVDSAIASKALIQFAWENVTSLTGHLEVFNIMAYLDFQRANIDTVTMTEALQPWTVPA